MLNTINDLRKGLDKLEELVKSQFPEDIKFTSDGIKVRKVHRQAEAGDYVIFNSYKAEDITTGKLYKVWGNAKYPKYTGDVGDKFLVYGWNTTPEVYEVVGDEDA